MVRTRDNTAGCTAPDAEQVAQSILSLNYSLRDQGHAITTLRDEMRYNTQQIQQLSEEFQMLRNFLMGAPLPPPPQQ
jgi:hypothetical protein